jgi:hypothetical protein
VTELPTQKYYNILEDYGESPADRYPARYQGRPMHERSASFKKLSQPMRSESFSVTSAPFVTPLTLSPDKAPGNRFNHDDRNIAGVGNVDVKHVELTQR